MKTPYGLMRDVNENYVINEKEADIVRLVFHLHHIGFSLGKIVDHLEARNILSPTGRPKWTRAAIDKMLKNHKYIAILGLHGYLITQADREFRSNIEEDSGKRKTTRHCSEKVLNGLILPPLIF